MARDVRMVGYWLKKKTNNKKSKYHIQATQILVHVQKNKIVLNIKVNPV